MRTRDGDIWRRTVCEERVDNLIDRPTRRNDVIVDNTTLATDIPGKARNLGLAMCWMELVTNGKRNIQTGCQLTNRLYTPFIRGHKADIFHRLLSKVIRDNRDCREVVNRDIKEALDCIRMEVHRNNMMCTCGGQQVGDELGGDRLAWTILLLLPRIAVVGNHTGDAVGGRTLESIHSNKELHQIAINRSAGWLDKEDI